MGADEKHRGSRMKKLSAILIGLLVSAIWVVPMLVLGQDPTAAPTPHEDIGAIVKDLLDNGYDGGISMEPHLAVVVHDASVESPDEIRFANYVEYGRRFMKLLEDIGHGDKIG